jgi:glycosyltransferase involved in cell wall biosynthesis
MSDLKKSKRPQALYISPELPYPDTHGRRIRQAVQIEALAQDYEITVAIERQAPTIRSLEIAIERNLRVKSWTSPPIAHADPTRSKLSVEDYFDEFRFAEAFSLYLTFIEDLFDTVPPDLQNANRSRYLSSLRSNRFDLVWVSRLATAWTIGAIGPFPSVLDMDDSESGAYKSQRMLAEGMSADEVLEVSRRVSEISRVENELGQAYDVVTFSAAEEAESAGLANARVLENCVPPRLVPRSGRSNNSDRILFIGLVEYAPNLHGICWFLKQVWPRLRASRPAATLDIVGECFNANAHPNLICPPNVRLHGFVEDTSTLWEEATLLVVPLFAGGGTRVKILEAWSRGVPVVTTTMGIAGLDAIDGVHALIADTPEDFAKKCDALLGSPALQETLALAGGGLTGSKYKRDNAIAATRRIAQEASARFKLRTQSDIPDKVGGLMSGIASKAITPMN